MQIRTRRTRRVAVAVAGLAAVCALAIPAGTAHAATSYTPSSSEWWMSQWKVPQEVWPVSQGAGVTVGVIDSGVQPVPDLRGVLKPGADMFGDPGSGEHDYGSGNGHGTTVAVLLAGQGYGTGTVGIAPQAKILPVHAIDPSHTSQTIINGIKYAVDHGASVINLSLGQVVSLPTSCDTPMQQAISYALAHNVVVVAAAGDTNMGDGAGPEEPATCAGVLAVGGVEQDGSLWSGSTQGPNVSVAAPADHMVGIGLHGGSGTGASGTSFAAPLVSGAAALIRSKYPSMPWYQVDQRLINTAIATGPVPNNGTGYGIINIAKAVDVAHYPVKASAPNPPYTRYRAYLKSTGQTGGAGAQAAPSASPKSGGSSVGLIIGIVVGVLVVIAVIVLVIVLAVRSRNRRGPRNPGGGGYPPSPYGHPAGQYPPPGQQYPQGQYQPGPYQQQYPPAQPPGQYPPPKQ